MKLFRYLIPVTAITAFGLLMFSLFKKTKNQPLEPFISWFGVLLGMTILMWSLQYGIGRTPLISRGGKPLSPNEDPIFYWLIIILLAIVGTVTIIFSLFNVFN
jgi:uncharacterized membrane-anchored protein